jgi:dienelactone hydrolase
MVRVDGAPDLVRPKHQNPAALAAPGDPSPAGYPDKSNLLVYVDQNGTAQPVRTVADWEERRAHILVNLQLVMGDLPEESRKVPLDLRVIEDMDLCNYVRKKISFAVEAWDRVSAYLLIPKRPKGKCPAMLCLHPTSAHGKGVVVGLGDVPHRDYAAELAERGYVTLAPDYPGFGDDTDARKALYAHGYVSCTMKGIWNHMRAVDVLQSLPEVDGERIGCIGHSLGGHNTLFLGVFDSRIRVIVSSCGFNAFAKYYDGDLTGWSHDGYMPRIATVYGKDPAKMPFDFPEVLGALAPRPVFVNAPLHDTNFAVSGVRDCIRAAEPIYGLYGVAANLVVIHPDCEHDFLDEARRQAYAFIDHALRPQER